MRQPFFSEHILESSTAAALLLRKPVSLSSVASLFSSCISCEFDMMLSILRMRTSGLKGFLMKSDTPTSKPLVSVSTSSSAVRNMTGVFITPFCCSICLNLPRVSKPSMTGILMSRRTRSGKPFSLTYSRNELPDLRAVTRILFLLRICPAILRLAVSSSTTIIHFVI